MSQGSKIPAKASQSVAPVWKLRATSWQPADLIQQEEQEQEQEQEREEEEEEEGFRLAALVVLR